MRRNLTLIGIAACTLVSGVALWLDTEHKKSKVVQSLNDVSTALWNYRDYQDQPKKWLPEAVATNGVKHTWRMGLLPFLEHMHPEALKRPWREGPLSGISHRTYCITGEERGDGLPATNCLAVVGPGTLAGGTVFENDAIILVVVGDTDIGWGDTGDLQVDAQRHVVGTWPRPIYDRWIGVAFGDGRTWLLRKDTPRDRIELFFTVASARQHCAEDVLGPFVVYGD